MTHLAPGTILGGRHRIESLIGQGGFGAVYCATQLALDRSVALKVLLPEALGEEGLQRLQREAEIVQRLDHPNIVRLLDFGVGAGAEPYLVFELLHGQTLEEVIQKGGPLSPARAARVGAQVLKALMAAHARGVVHRDIKPGNIFLCNFHGERDFVKVLDFGIAKGDDSRTLTGKGGVVGTPAYMAPEQVNGGEVTFAADLFALGLTLEEALTGRAVYGDLSVVDIVREHLSSPAVPHAPAVLSTPLGPIIQRATMKQPELRYPSAAEMLAHLEAAMSGQVTVRASRDAVTPGVLLPAPPALPRKRRAPPWALLAALGGGMLLLGGGLFAVMALAGDRPKDPRKAAASASASSSGTPESQSVWETLRPEGALAEVDANADGAPDFIAFCGDDYGFKEGTLCAVDGATIRFLWRKPLGITRGVISNYTLAGSGRRFALIDPTGVAHVHDAASGAEISAHRVGGRVVHACVPPDLPGKIWLKTTDPRGVMLDLAAGSVSDAPRPASCKRARRELACLMRIDPNVCPPDLQHPRSRELELQLSSFYVDGGHGVAFAEKKGDRSRRLIVGFDGRGSGGANDREVQILWQRPVSPNAVGKEHFEDFAVRGGRAVAAYDTAQATRVVAVDVATGRTLWDEETNYVRALVLTSNRVYLERNHGLDVRDAANGRLLGSIGR